MRVEQHRDNHPKNSTVNDSFPIKTWKTSDRRKKKKKKTICRGPQQVKHSQNPTLTTKKIAGGLDEQCPTQLLNIKESLRNPSERSGLQNVVE